MLPKWLRRVRDKFGPRRDLQVVEGDSLPERLPRRNLVLAREGDEDWCVGMRCPCGCGQTIELLLIQEAKPRWDLLVDWSGRPSLKPSVWLQTGCRSHFWLRRGRVEWCD
jgi:hypothetical protein